MKILKIYFSKDKKSYQIVHPSEHFKGDYKGLVQGICGDNYHSFEVL